MCEIARFSSSDSSAISDSLRWGVKRTWLGLEWMYILRLNDADKCSYFTASGESGLNGDILTKAKGRKWNNRCCLVVWSLSFSTVTCSLRSQHSLGNTHESHVRVRTHKLHGVWTASCCVWGLDFKGCCDGRYSYRTASRLCSSSLLLTTLWARELRSCCRFTPRCFQLLSSLLYLRFHDVFSELQLWLNFYCKPCCSDSKLRIIIIMIHSVVQNIFHITFTWIEKYVINPKEGKISWRIKT